MSDMFQRMDADGGSYGSMPRRAKNTVRYRINAYSVLFWVEDVEQGAQVGGFRGG
jgi:hypothetical protein